MFILGRLMNLILQNYTFLLLSVAKIAIFAIPNVKFEIEI